MSGLVSVCKCISFLEVISCFELPCLLVQLQTYIWKKTKLGIANWPIESNWPIETVVLNE